MTWPRERGGTSGLKGQYTVKDKIMWFTNNCVTKERVPVATQNRSDLVGTIALVLLLTMLELTVLCRHSEIHVTLG
ncbi:unnamed protein product [Pleuronectes platessa]|uniref:Uncharacterized protein n=1 Tax=Pleuronectes platessa TaxID=8262 RepID=A0A9N7VYT9_PLEPL|nr:unnamed protein product [Pleuronectes platessa]